MTVTEDVAAYKERQRAVWVAGDPVRAAHMTEEVAELCADRAGIDTNMDVLDVGTGTGAAAIAAALRGADVVGLDFAPELLALARDDAAEAGADVAWVEGDAEALPFEDASFDRVISTFGVQFVPRHRVAAAELVRVCRPGGRIVMCNWTPDGFAGEANALLARYLVARPPFASPPPLWGHGPHVRAIFAETSATIPSLEKRVLRIPAESPDAFVDYVSRVGGPFVAVREERDEAAWKELRDELAALAAAFWRGGAIEQEYAVITVAR
jgi:ubiquinone/menaquinone biosynthesis C-methylase UbiE